MVNENDSVSSAEIETGQCKVLGDNDTLSAIVARLCGAGLLVLFSDIDGLYDADPRTHPDARLIHQVEAITPELRAMAGGAGTWRGTGGMATKLNAAQLCLEAGWTWSSPTGRGWRPSTTSWRGRTWAPAFLPGGARCNRKEGGIP